MEATIQSFTRLRMERERRERESQARRLFWLDKSEEAIQPARSTRPQSPDSLQIAFKSAFKIGAKVALIAVEEKSESHFKEWKRHRDINDALAVLGFRFLHRMIERLDESQDK